MSARRASALAVSSHGSAQSCPGSPIAVQILASGGLAINRDRESSAYLLWVGPQVKILVDMGGGAFLRYGLVGPAGREIHIDKYGRVKVQFHWHSAEAKDDKRLEFLAGFKLITCPDPVGAGRNATRSFEAL